MAEQQTQQQPQPVAQMTITLLSNGCVNVNGPLMDLRMCRHMLNGARDAVEDFERPTETPALVIAQDLPPALASRINGKRPG